MILTQGEKMKIACPDFKQNESIPSLYTCEGKNTIPPLEFSDIPPHAKSLVLILDDPDVPAEVRSEKMYDHWIVFNIPPNTQKIEANKKPPGMQGQNTSGHNEYTGPCPPHQYEPKEHRYHFKLYALDQMLPLKEGATKLEIEIAMKKHILAEATLIGLYEKHRK